MNSVESETLELKTSTAELNEAVIAIVAMLNKHNKGELYFGIKNSGEVIGQDVSDKTLRDISKSISDHIEPKIYPRIEHIKIENKSIVKIYSEANTLFLSKDIEHWGSGLKRINDECKAAGIKVTFEILKTGFLVSFYRSKQAEGGVSEGVNRLVNYIKNNPGKRVPAMVKALNIPGKTIERWLKDLKEKGKVEYRGSSKKGGYWEIIEK